MHRLRALCAALTAVIASAHAAALTLFAEFLSVTAVITRAVLCHRSGLELVLGKIHLGGTGIHNTRLSLVPIGLGGDHGGGSPRCGRGTLVLHGRGTVVLRLLRLLRLLCLLRIVQRLCICKLLKALLLLFLAAHGRLNVEFLCVVLRLCLLFLRGGRSRLGLLGGRGLLGLRRRGIGLAVQIVIDVFDLIALGQDIHHIAEFVRLQHRHMGASLQTDVAEDVEDILAFDPHVLCHCIDAIFLCCCHTLHLL